MPDFDLSRLLEEHASAQSVPGAALGVLHDGEVSTAYAGVADTTSGEPVTPETRFAIGSLGKPMVATVIAGLAAAGRLSLDDPAATHVPELRGSAWAAQATVRDLLANRARVPLTVDSEFSGSPGEEDDDVLSRYAARVAAGVPTPPLWSYTNAGWCLLGRAIEEVIGLVWEDAMEAQLLTPLALAQTTFATSLAAEHRASGHAVTTEGVVPVATWAPRGLGPAGGTLHSTVTDLLRVADVHLRDPSLALLRASHADVRLQGWFDAWCLGWARFDWEGAPVWGWDGVIAGQRAFLRLVPDRLGAIALMTNADTGRRTYRSLFAELMKELFAVGMPTAARAAASTAGDDLSRFEGVYAWPDWRWEVTATRDRLALECDGQTIEALPLDDGSFLVDDDNPDWPTVTFADFDSEGRPGVLYRMLWGLPRER